MIIFIYHYCIKYQYYGKEHVSCQVLGMRLGD